MTFIPPNRPWGGRQILIIQTLKDAPHVKQKSPFDSKSLQLSFSNVACANASTCLFRQCINGQRRKRICLISFLHQKCCLDSFTLLATRWSESYSSKQVPPPPHPCPGPPLTARGTSEAAATKCHHNCPAV